MFYDENDGNFEDDFEEQSKEITEKIKAEARKEFISGCYMAYEMLVNDGKAALKSSDMGSICNAINRMMSLFIMKEEYERCQFLKNFVKKYIPNHEIVPDPSVMDELEA